MGFLRFARGAFSFYAGCLGVYARNHTARYVRVTFPPGVWGCAGMRVRKYSQDETTRDVTGQYACYHLPHRTVVKLQGQDTSPFIQGLITNDIGLLEEPGETAMYAHMLNVQGRTLYDIILYRYIVLFLSLLMRFQLTQGRDVLSHGPAADRHLWLLKMWIFWGLSLVMHCLKLCIF